jgi:hypothetical protein
MNEGRCRRLSKIALLLASLQYLKNISSEIEKKDLKVFFALFLQVYLLHILSPNYFLTFA